MDAPEIAYEPLSFSALAGWADGDHREALLTFQSTYADGAMRRVPGSSIEAQLQTIAARVALFVPNARSPEDARRFFESEFSAHRLIHTGDPGLLTGYYEPVLDGSRSASATYAVPIYRRPPELATLVDDARRGTVGSNLTHAVMSPAGPVPFATRAQIEDGALAGRALELLYFADPVDVFFLHVQGSGRIRPPDGQMVRVTYDGKNGHPYSSVGRHLIASGDIAEADMSLAALGEWLRAEPERGRRAMQENASYVFFRELIGPDAAPLGVHGIRLTEGRSLAVDTSVHAIGTPIWVSAPTLPDAFAAAPGVPFRRLMIAQDVGSAIRGPERGDIFFGSGDGAGVAAGTTRHPGSFVVLLPRNRA